MKFVKPIILGSIVLSVIVLVVYFGFNTQDIPTQDNPDSANSELIKWSNGILFDVFVDPKDIVNIDGRQIPLKGTFKLKPNLSDIYSEIGVYDEKNKPLVIIPVYTASAYAKNGFYDFYNGYCDNTCLTTKIVSIDELGEQSSANAVKVLELLGYDSVTDMELDKNPSILTKYDKVIMLHSEYVTKKCLMQ